MRTSVRTPASAPPRACQLASGSATEHQDARIAPSATPTARHPASEATCAHDRLAARRAGRPRHRMRPSISRYDASPWLARIGGPSHEPHEVKARENFANKSTKRGREGNVGKGRRERSGSPGISCANFSHLPP